MCAWRNRPVHRRAPALSTLCLLCGSVTMGEVLTVEGLDIDRLRWRRSTQPAASSAPARLPKHRPGERFLKGPIPWSWLTLAARQPGKALQVALALWHLAGMKGTQGVALNLSRLESLGVSRHAASRGLKALVAAGLAHVDARQGRKALVTLLECPERTPDRCADGALSGAAQQLMKSFTHKARRQRGARSPRGGGGTGGRVDRATRLALFRSTLIVTASAGMALRELSHRIAEACPLARTAGR
jgi:hypothetical protein